MFTCTLFQIEKQRMRNGKLKKEKVKIWNKQFLYFTKN